MKFETAAPANPIDRQQVVGRPTDRIEGPLKVTGTATYAYEWSDVVSNPAVGYVVGAAVAKGRIVRVDEREARRAPGVLEIVTASNAGPLSLGKYNTAALLGGPEIQHYHQAVALVIATTFEQARAAAGLLHIEYERASGSYDLAAAKDSAIPLPTDEDKNAKDDSLGDFDKAFAAAPLQLDATYTTPDQSHAMMEPHASIAAWSGEKLTLWTSNQMIAWSVGDLAKTLKISKENIRVLSPYVGGGFGGKLFVRADALLASLGARALGRPVKVALTRPMMANNTTHRPATIQRIRIGVTPDGKITAIAHGSWSGNLAKGKPELAARSTSWCYAGANRLSTTRLATLDLPEGNAMRAPGDAPGSMALEIAMDEMAEKAGLDPVEFRILNDTQINPEDQRPFSQRNFVDCLRRGAEQFGWNQRKATPGALREGRWLIGLGVAGAFRASPVMKSAARVRLDSRGIVTVETDMTDIGTGSYTILAQTAAEMLGVPLKDVEVRLGDSAYPVSSGSGGQFGANSSTSGVYAACVKLREAVAKKFGFDAEQCEFTDGKVIHAGTSRFLAEAAEDADLEGEDAIEFGKITEKNQAVSFGSHFVEVAVDSATGEVRVRRMLAVCAAGRILNPKSARSQMIGAMTMGVGAALMEELVVDKRRGFFVNHDLASYEVPVHADIPHQEVIFLDETDPLSSPMKARGVGELGICGAPAAVANAIYNATGVRIRDYPMTLDKLLDHLPPVT